MPRFLSPVLHVIRHFLPLQSARLRLIALLGILASLVKSAGYVVLHPLLDYVTRNQTVIVIGPARFEPGPFFFVALVGVVVVLLAGALQLNYLVHTTSLDVLRRTAAEAAVEGLLRLRRLQSASGGWRRAKLAKAVQEIAGQTAFACGFAMKQVASSIADLLELSVFLVVLVWLSPHLTLAFLAIAVIAGFLYARSVRAIAETIQSRKEFTRESRAEFKEIGRIVAESDADEAGLRQRLTALYQNGVSGRMLESKLDVHLEMKRGPLLIEYLFPIALIVLPMIALATDAFSQLASRLIIYVLILRNVISLLQRLASLFISTSRFHSQLTCYSDLLGEARTPRCLFAVAGGSRMTELEDFE